jgi:hypothetical protein
LDSAGKVQDTTINTEFDDGALSISPMVQIYILRSANMNLAKTLVVKYITVLLKVVAGVQVKKLK